MKHEDDPFDLKDYAVDPAPVPKAKTKPKKWRRHYVRVPWFWVERLRLAKRTVTYRLAFFVVYEHWRSGGWPIVLSNLTAAAEGMSPRAKSRALADLERLGLVKLERRTGRAPRLKVLHVKAD
jgi:hypothetical protein